TLPYSWVGLQTTRQPGGRALCVFDSRTYGLQGEEFDAMRTATLERAAAHGAVLLRHDRLDRLARLAAPLGFEEGRLARTLRAAGMELAEPPFYAMPVVQGVVDMAGGLEVDAELRLLDADRRPIPGLHA